MEPRRGRKFEITELILELRFIYETATASTPLSSHAVRTPATANRPGNGRKRLRAPGLTPNRVALARPPLATLPWSLGRPPRRPPCATPPKRRRCSPSPASVALPGRIDLPQAPPLRLPAGPPPPRAYRRRHFPCTRGQDAPAIFPNSGELGSPWSTYIHPSLVQINPTADFSSAGRSSSARTCPQSPRRRAAAAVQNLPDAGHRGALPSGHPRRHQDPQIGRARPPLTPPPPGPRCRRAPRRETPRPYPPMFCTSARDFP